MTLRRGTRLLPLLVLGFAPLAVALVASLGGCQPQIEETSSETLRHAAEPSLRVRLDRGSLTVSEHAGSEVEIGVQRSVWALSREAARAALSALLVEVVSDEGAETLVVTGRVGTTGAWRPGERARMSLDIAVPRGTGVDARTGSGRIELRSLSGATRAMTASGRIRASSLRSPAGPDAEPIRLRSGEGRIEGTDLEGSVHAETGEGRIQLAGRLGEVSAVSSEGRIEVEVAPLGPPLAGDWLLATGSGSVRLILPRDADARLSVAASEGTSRDDESEAIEWERLGPLAVATLGSGAGAKIRLRTDRGSARVRLRSED